MSFALGIIRGNLCDSCMVVSFLSVVSVMSPLYFKFFISMLSLSFRCYFFGISVPCLSYLSVMSTFQCHILLFSFLFHYHMSLLFQCFFFCQSNVFIVSVISLFISVPYVLCYFSAFSYFRPMSLLFQYHILFVISVLFLISVPCVFDISVPSLSDFGTVFVIWVLSLFVMSVPGLCYFRFHCHVLTSLPCLYDYSAWWHRAEHFERAPVSAGLSDARLGIVWVPTDSGTSRTAGQGWTSTQQVGQWQKQ